MQLRPAIVPIKVGMVVSRKLLSMRTSPGREAAAAEPGEGLCGAKEVGDSHAASRDCLSRQDDAHSALHRQGQQNVPAVCPPGVLLFPLCPSCCQSEKQDSTEMFPDKAVNSCMLLGGFLIGLCKTGIQKSARHLIS